MTVTVWDVVPVILPAVALSELVTLPVVTHELPLHVCADPETAAADNVYPVEQALQSSVDVSQYVAPVPSNTVGVPFGQVHVLTLHVCADPDAAAVDNVYPILHSLQSICKCISQSVPLLPLNTVGIPFGQVQIKRLQLSTAICCFKDCHQPIGQILQLSSPS